MIESNRDDDGGDKGHSDGGEGKGDEEEEEELSKQTVHHFVKEMLAALSMQGASTAQRDNSQL